MMKLLHHNHQYGVANQGGAGNTRAPARRPGRRTGLERGLDGGRDELRGLRVDDDVRRSRTRRTTCLVCRGASCGPMVAGDGPVASGSVTPGL